MKALIGIIFILLSLTINGEEELCKENRSGFKICEKSNAITQVTSIFGNRNLTLDLRSDKKINPNAFNNSNLLSLDLIFHGDEGAKTRPRLHLEPKSFAGLDTLRSLEIKYAHINSTGKPLAALESLVVLKVVNGLNSEVPIALLAPLPQLQELNLMQNAITVVPANAFPTKHLKVLNLSRNKITTLEPGCFNGLRELELLDLSINPLTSVPGVFNELISLKSLVMKLCGLQLKEIVPNAFRGMSALTSLELSGNGLRKLEPGMFDDLQQLRYLSLNANLIKHIPRGVFNGLTSLKGISMNFMLVRSVEPGAFAGLHIENFNLFGPKDIEPGTFSNLTVDNLFLSGSYIWDIKPRAFDGLIAKYVILSYNKISEIKPGAFAGLKAEVLDLSNNEIVKISPRAFRDSKIERISLGSNPIQYLNKTELGLSEHTSVSF